MLLKLAVSLQNNCYNLAMSFCAFSKQRQEPRPYSFFFFYYILCIMFLAYIILINDGKT